jgi:DNA-binding NtrC family response regulator
MGVDGFNPLSAANAAETILMVERDVLIRRAAAACLRECGLIVIEAVNVAEASEVLGSEVRVDIVIVDMASLGETPAFELAKWIRSRNAKVKVALMPTMEVLVRETQQLCAASSHAASGHRATLEQRLRHLVARHNRERRRQDLPKA